MFKHFWCITASQEHPRFLLNSKMQCKPNSFSGTWVQSKRKEPHIYEKNFNIILPHL